MGYIDLHCDVLLHFLLSDDFDLFSSERSSVDLDRLHRAGAMAQCFAIYQPSVDELKAKRISVIKAAISPKSDRVSTNGKVVFALPVAEVMLANLTEI